MANLETKAVQGRGTNSGRIIGTFEYCTYIYAYSTYGSAQGLRWVADIDMYLVQRSTYHIICE